METPNDELLGIVLWMVDNIKTLAWKSNDSPPLLAPHRTWNVCQTGHNLNTT